MNKANYDAYIKAFRWSSDRLDDNGGVICFVSNGAWLDGNSASGFRKSLEKEFTSIYVFNLRGNQRTSGELSRKEGGKIFGSGSRTPISITLLVKNPKNEFGKSRIHYHDIGDYLSREEKLEIIRQKKTIKNESFNWEILVPNEHGDWLNQRDDKFSEFIPIADKSGNESSIFLLNSNGIVTNRDSWVYNFSSKELRLNMESMISFYNQQTTAYKEAQKENSNLKVEDFVSTDPKKIKWVQNLYKDAEKGLILNFNPDQMANSFYRPFNKQILYKHRNFVWSPYLQNKLFPNKNVENLVICATGVGASKDFTTLITNVIPNLDGLEKLQSFPLYFFEENNQTQKGLFDEGSENDYLRRDGVSDFILERALKQYNTKAISKEDIFYYVYVFLHSPEYRETFANDLKKMLPRLPLVDDVKEFWAFSNAGRKLAELHLNYETVPAYAGVTLSSSASDNMIDYQVEKMRFPKKGQKDTIIYNSKITISNIPEEAFEYVVNGKSAIEWIMERYAVTTHKDSGITNNPNDWADEVGNPKYILDLLLSIINVSVQTVEIVNGLPGVKFD